MQRVRKKTRKKKEVGLCREGQKGSGWVAEGWRWSNR